MDQTTFDATGHPGVQPGRWLEVLGPQLFPDDVAEATRTNGCKVLNPLRRRFRQVCLAA